MVEYSESDGCFGVVMIGLVAVFLGAVTLRK
jgi:hypothetical protein